ncbi:MAG: hypothetical protein GEU75_12345 [Dehalococcoidia bacterium]|nr:hypothetical protein [Dehalococcoidia bacterium]
MQEAPARPGKDRLTKFLMGLAAVLAVTVIALGAFILGRESNAGSSTSVAASSDEFDFSILNRIRDILSRDYARQDNLDDQTLYEAAIQACSTSSMIPGLFMSTQPALSSTPR